MRIDSDIDIDFGNRDELLKVIKHTPAAMRNVKPMIVLAKVVKFSSHLILFWRN